MVGERFTNQMGVCLQGTDRITSLPTELVNKILTLVPIRDVVRTSALSRKWRYKWMYIPEIVFDARSIPPSIQEQRNLADSVNHVLSLHYGRLNKFGMSGYLVSSCNDVDRWILLLCRKSVKMIILDFPQGDRYKVPSSLFSCQKLELLKLHCSILNLPSHAKCFENLVDLDLCQVTLTNETIARLMVNCPLQKLILTYCDGFTRLNICAPNLIIFVLCSPCGSIYFDNTPQLRSANIEMLPLVSEASLPDQITNRLDVRLTGLINVQELYICKNFMEILAAHVIPERLCFTYHILTTMSLVMNFANPKQNSTALCLFRSSPYLLSLCVTSVSSGQITLLDDDNIWEPIPDEEIIFARLKNMVLNGFMGSQHEASFVQFVLRSAVMLHTIRITWDATVEKGTKRMDTLEDMMQFCRASPRARVIFSG
ncbi:hypothetical protein IFM89_004295 [Coptis chinensis]|uniref:F-box domain-containing protein n=1 Tax=Coptis chinensis TaxID=261450 RepID=A0A835M3Q5_9MAGN|nr:hypothetical protein IFM89_004295 [Coptis chinensis]